MPVVVSVTGVLLDPSPASSTTDTAAGADEELSPRATNSAAPTTPIATAVPTDIPPDAPEFDDCALTLATEPKCN